MGSVPEPPTNLGKRSVPCEENRENPVLNGSAPCEETGSDQASDGSVPCKGNNCDQVNLSDEAALTSKVE